MQPIDERGRLFGAVNVIDALVVVFTVSLVIAGVAFVAAPSEPRATRYVTVALDERPAEIAVRVQPGDATLASLRGGGTDAGVRVTDVYRAPAGTNVSTVVRLQVRGVLVDDGKQLTVGRRIELVTNGTSVPGRVIAIDDAGRTLPVVERSVTLSATVPTAVARAIETGDEMIVAGSPVATVEAIAVGNASAPAERRVELTLRLRTLERRTGLWFGTGVVRLGAPLSFYTEEYELRGTVTGVTEVAEVAEVAEVTVVSRA